MAVTIIPLSHLAVLQARGPQAADFLQAQLTQEVRKWPEDTARMAAFCTPQGRILADFLLWKTGNGDIVMLLDAALAEATLKRLRMFILRLQCKLDDSTAEHRLFGILQRGEQTDTIGPEAWPCPAEPWGIYRREGIVLIRLPDAPGARRFLLVAENAAGVRAADELHAHGDAGTQDEWQLMDIRAGIAHVGAATMQQFVPQMLNYEALGVIDFQKGCYPGQEIVARTQYRGTIKRRTYRVTSMVPLEAGDEVFHSSDPDQPSGMIVTAAHAEEGWEALAELKIAAATEGGTLSVRSSGGPPLTLATLPYALPPQD